MSINLRTGEYYPPRPEDLCTKSTSVGPKDIPIPLWTIAQLQKLGLGQQ